MAAPLGRRIGKPGGPKLRKLLQPFRMPAFTLDKELARFLGNLGPEIVQLFRFCELRPHDTVQNG